ncbi:MAG: hypothetical protein V2A66_07380 [Pseudomonadota bacterium]
MRNLFKASKIARALLVVYAVTLTGAVVFALTAGPFQETFRLWSKTRLAETKLEESEQGREKLEAERGRLLDTIKNLQTDWTGAQETIRALRELTQDPDKERRLVELNRQVGRLDQEKAVLILKLKELRQAIQAAPGNKPGSQ